MQILGILVMAVAALASLSMLTYTPSDDGIIRSTPFVDLLAQDGPASVRIQNGLGPLGAFIAYYTVYATFGYFTAALPLLLFWYGWRVFTRRKRRALHRLSLLLIPLIAFFSTLGGWFHEVPGWVSFAWAGTLGSGIAGALIGLLSGLGAGVLLFALLSMMLLFVADLDITRLPGQINNARRNMQRDLMAWLEKRRYGLHDELGPEDTEAESPSSEAAPEKKKAAQHPAAGGDEQHQHGIPYPESAEADEEAVLDDDDDNENFRTPFAKSDAARTAPDSDNALEVKPPVEETSEIDEGGDKATASDDDRPAKNKGEETPSEKLPSEEEWPFAGEATPKPRAEKEQEAQPSAKETYVSINDMFKKPFDAPEEEEEKEYEKEKDEKPQPHQKPAPEIQPAVQPEIYTYPGYDLLRGGKQSEQPFVALRELIEGEALAGADMALPLALGRPFAPGSKEALRPRARSLDLADAPHLLMAGAVGSGLNNGLNALLISLLYHVDAEEMRLLLMDPLNERLISYADIQEHYLATLPGQNSPAIASGVEESLQMLGSLCTELEQREEKMKAAMADNIMMYNRSLGGIRTGRGDEERPMPRIVAVVSEFAPLAINAGPQLQELLNRLMPGAREAGIHLIIATRRPSPRVIPKSISAFFKTRLAYRLPMALDSRLLLDSDAACHINGNGDFLLAETGSTPEHLQQAYVSEAEVRRVAAFIKEQPGAPGAYLLPQAPLLQKQQGLPAGQQDALLGRAARITLVRRSISTSILQRRLNVPYKRAEHILEQLYQTGITGPWEEGGRRRVLGPVSSEADIRQRLNEAGIR